MGGRSAAEIAERFLDQATLAEGAGVSAEKRALAEAFFAIEGAPDIASAALRKLAEDARLDLTAALDSFDTRASFIGWVGCSCGTACVVSATGTREMETSTLIKMNNVNPPIGAAFNNNCPNAEANSVTTM